MENLELLDQFEVGGSFFELIEFSLNRQLANGQILRGIYGVNVGKVREVVHMPKINPLASRIPGIAGIFELRGVPIPAINLCRILGDHNAPITADQQIIVTEFSEKRAGFIVTTTHRIRRIAWEKVLPPSSDTASCMSGMILIEDNEFLFILDLEKILNDIEVSHGAAQNSPYGSGAGGLPMGLPQGVPVVPQPQAANRGPCILFVDDSSLVLNNVGRALKDQGYQVATASNGIEALDKLDRITKGQDSDLPKVDCLISDVEMPLMDGMTLVKKVRADERFEQLPILFHTSLSGDVSQLAGQDAGANGYVVKNDIGNLIEMLGRLLPSG